MTPARLFDIIENRPENLLLVGTPSLLGFVRDGDNAPDLRSKVLAELGVRWCLSRDDTLADVLFGLWEESWPAFMDWYQLKRPWTGNRTLPEQPGTWKDPQELPGFESVLRQRLLRLFAVKGFVPVCCGTEAWFIPFVFDNGVDGAVWRDGNPIPEWSGAVREALAGTEMRGIRLQLLEGPELSGGVKGRSLMLPVRMAALRGTLDGLPDYDPLRVLATGEFDRDFHLADVEVAPKFEAAKRQFQDAVLFAPDVPGAVERGEPAFHPLDIGLDEKSILGRIRSALERTPACLNMTRDYALRCLLDVYSTVEAPAPGNFAGRDKELERLWRQLGNGKIPVITGAGGTGKSELVRQYAVRHREEYPGGMFQIDMERVANWSDAFLRLLDRHSNNGLRVAEFLGVKTDKPSDAPSGKDVRDALIQHARQSGAVLLVLDNVESCDELFGDGTGDKRLFPSGLVTGVKIDVVATARVCNASSDAVVQFPLGDLSPKASLELLLSNHAADTEKERKAAARVARLLGCRALFLRHVPAIIGSKNIRNAKMVCRSYSSLAEALEKNPLPTIGRTGKVDGLHLPEKMWSLTRDALAGNPFGDALVRLVRLAARFPADGFPRHILRRLWDEEVFPEVREVGVSSDEAFDFVLGAGQAYNIFQDTDPVRIHRLDREAILHDPESDGPELARAVGRALSGYLGASPGVWLSLAAFPDIVRHIPSSVQNGRLYARLLSDNPALEELCPWDSFDGRDWAMLLARQPQFSVKCPWNRLKEADWGVLLAKQPQFSGRCPQGMRDGLDSIDWVLLSNWDEISQGFFPDKCPPELLPILTEDIQNANESSLNKLSGEAWADLLSRAPQFAAKCPWDKMDGKNWVKVLKKQPQMAVMCPWEKLDAGIMEGRVRQAGLMILILDDDQKGWLWTELLCKQPQFANRCPWNILSGGNWAKLLCFQPQFADRCPWEKLESRDWTKLLGNPVRFRQFADKCPLEKLNGRAWGHLLRYQPQLAERCPWDALREEWKGGDWLDLLRDYPQFEDKCPWDKFDGDDWVCLLPWCDDKCPWEKLNSRNWARLLGNCPEYADKCPWEQLATDLNGEEWAVLICDQPQFADKCPWEKLGSRDWAALLANQPQFADQCPWKQLEIDLDGEAWARLLVYQPQFRDKCPWEKLKLDSRDWAELLSVQPLLADRCPWQKMAADDFQKLLGSQPQFADRRPTGTPVDDAGGRYLWAP